MKKILLSLGTVLCVGFCSAGSVIAQDSVAPDQLVKTLTDQVLDIVRNDKSLKAGKTESAVKKIETVVKPHFDFRRMTMLAVGRYWRDATAEQKDRLVEEFYTLLVRTYSNALTQYSNQTVRFKPFRMAPEDKTVRVQTDILQSGAQPVTVDYVLENRSGDWKVFDVVVAGVSLVTNYRSNFAQEVASGGIDGLIRSLDERNNSLDQSTQQP